MLYNTVILSEKDESHIYMRSDEGIQRELYEFFKFRTPNAQFDPRVKRGQWDGYIKLYNLRDKTIYKGLIPYIEKFCEEREYRIQNDIPDAFDDEVSVLETVNFLKEIKVPFKPRDYQVKGIIHCLRKKRALILSPTASGKSFSIYSVIRWYQRRTLLIVPTTHLVHQMFGDFADYSKQDSTWQAELRCSKFMGGTSKVNLHEIVIGTWQSIINQPPEWLEQFEVVIVDEAHGAKAKSITTIMDRSINAKYRFGFTGTLDGTQTHKLVLEGLFGEAKQIIETHELMEKNYLAKLNIKCLTLNYGPETIKNCPKKYPEEIAYLIENEKRNNFIANLACSLKGNTLVLFQFVEKHGEILYNMIDERKGLGQTAYYIHGGIDAQTRDDYRKEVEASTGNIMIASLGTFSTGVNIVNINNIIFASPSKSRIRNLQSIGRGLRRGKDKDSCTLFDIADDLSNKKYKNYTLRHFFERVRIYNEQKFDYQIYRIRIK